MQSVSLPYGSTEFALSFDPERFQVLVPGDGSQPNKAEFLVDSAPLPELLTRRRVPLIVSDLTRPTGSLEFILRPKVTDISCRMVQTLCDSTQAR